MPRPKGSLNKKKSEKRLQKTQQVKDYKYTTGFGIQSYYEPLKDLSVSQIRDFLLASAWIDICVNTIVDEVIKYPLASEPRDEKIEAFLKIPSQTEPLMMIRKKYLKDMFRFGNGACSIIYKSGVPYSLAVVPGYLIRMTDNEPPTYKIFEMTQGGGISRTFKKDKNGVEIELKTKELMLFQIDADSDSSMARAPIEKIYNYLNIDENIAKHLAEFTSRGFHFPVFISLEKTNKTDVDAFVEYMDNMISEGSKVFGINKAATLTEIKHWTPEQIIATSKWIGTIVANAYKVPPFMLNLVQDVGSLSAREQKARFLENVCQPILQYEAQIYTLILAYKGFENLDVEITSPLIGTKLNWDRARIARLLVGQEDILTATEARKLFFNLPPKEETKKK